MFLRRAQITMETIFIYGLIALVVLSGIGALIYFGVFDLQSYLPDKCTMQDANLGCGTFKITSVATDPDGILFELRNNANKGIEVSTVTLVSQDGLLLFAGGSSASLTQTTLDLYDTSTGTYVVAAQNAAGAYIIGPKQTFAFRSAPDYVPTAYAGQKLKFDVLVDYNLAGSGVTQRARGEIFATVIQ